MYADASVYFKQAKKVARGTHKERSDVWKKRYSKIEDTFRARTGMAGQVGQPDALLIESGTGYTAAASDSFESATEILKIGRELLRHLDIERLERANRNLENHAYKPQLLHLNLESEYLDVESPFLRFALDPSLVAALTRYFGFVPILYKMNYWYSRHVESDRPINSQMFHLDWDDLKTVRVFLYITDVTVDQGPMVILNATDSMTVSDILDHERSDYWRITDEKMYAMMSPSRFDTLTGPSGMVAMADPARCYHYGSRVQPGSSPRFLISFWYVSPAAFWLPLEKDYEYPYQRLAASGSLNDAQKMVLGSGPAP